MKGLSDLKKLFLSQLRDQEVKVSVNNPENSLPGFISINFSGYSGNEIVAAMALSGFSLSTGSACHANETEPSRIVFALVRN